MGGTETRKGELTREKEENVSYEGAFCRSEGRPKRATERMKEKEKEKETNQQIHLIPPCPPPQQRKEENHGIIALRPGNVHFQKVIEENKILYAQANSREEKRNIINDVITQSQKNEARARQFLKLCSKRKVWVPISSSTEIERRIGMSLEYDS